MAMTDEIELIRPDDWHLHLREGALMALVLGHSARVFGRALVMPNLAIPLTTLERIADYRRRILAALPVDTGFEPLMTLYLTSATAPEEVRRVHAAGWVKAVKLFPAGATTHSDLGVCRLTDCTSVFETMVELDLPLSVHGEVADDGVDIFDRERVFIERELVPLRRRFPRLRIVLEHLSTLDGVEFVRDAGVGVAGTITAHHLLLNRNALLAGGLNPHHYCLPVIKTEADRQALLEAATSGHPGFFLGTDSAPHWRIDKEGVRGRAGIYTAANAIGLYAEVFESMGRISRLEAFASVFGARFYRLPVNTERIRLVREAEPVPASYSVADGDLVPFRAGGPVNWRVKGFPARYRTPP
jgi:dihydroorotase